MRKRIFQAKLVQNEKTHGCAIILPFNPKEVFGKVRTPVQVTINDHTFRTTTASMKGYYLIPVNRTNRERANIQTGDSITVTLRQDTAPRTVQVPADLRDAIHSDNYIKRIWDKLSYTHKKEYVQAVLDAKKPETRQRRINKTLEMLSKKAT